MFKPTRWVVGVLVGAAAAAAIAAPGVGAKPKPGKADSGTLYAAITHTNAATKTEFIAGDVSDKLLGPGAATYDATVGTGATPGTLTVTAKVITFFKNGSLSGTASATATTAANGSVTLSNGKITLKNGAGAQKGHTLVATFTATAKGITGPYVFKYKGTYK